MTILGVLGLLFAFLVWGRVRYDIVAFAALMLCVLLGLIPTPGAFAGFGHPATVTVAFILILSRGLAASGATDMIAKAIHPATASTICSLPELRR